jgi:hypothetical protein
VHDRAAKLAEPCAGCGGDRTGWAVQSVEDGRLHWALEWSCSCGESCDRGRGPAPAEVRAAVVARHGTHRLFLVDPRVRSGAIPKAFRDVFSLPLGAGGRAGAPPPGGPPRGGGRGPPGGAGPRGGPPPGPGGGGAGRPRGGGGGSRPDAPPAGGG